jgi:hypothetical protein
MLRDMNTMKPLATLGQITNEMCKAYFRVVTDKQANFIKVVSNTHRHWWK